jgi:pimeloyl-ACP methyl ester carboxylesterase
MSRSFFLMWLTGLVSLVILWGGAYIVWAWYLGERPGLASLMLGIAMLLYSVLGRYLVLLMRRPAADDPRSKRAGEELRIKGPDGSELQVEIYGMEQRPTLLMTHGWDLDATAWYYQKKNLSKRFRLVLWDLPGLGKSSQPADGHYSLERLAQALRVVLARTGGGRPVVLVGHSIGGMTLLTFCRLFPELLGREVAGIVFVNTTYTQPLNTVTAGRLLRAIQKPILEPLLHLTIWLYPLVWLMNWQSYLSGSSHRAISSAFFSGHESWRQLDFAAYFAAKMSPAVLAKGILAMLRWDETATLPHINLPTLIITSDADRVTLPEASRAMAASIPGAQLVQVSPAGHLGFLEQSKCYDAAIADFAARCVES